MEAKRSPFSVVASTTVLFLVAVTGCVTGNRHATNRTCVFFAKETSYLGQSCDPNGSMTLLWDDVSHAATGGAWNEEVTGGLPAGESPCSVFPASVVSGTVIPGGTSGSTHLAFIQPTWPLCPPAPTPCFLFMGTLSADGKTLDGVLDKIPFVAKGETICTCRKRPAKPPRA